MRIIVTLCLLVIPGMTIGMENAWTKRDLITKLNRTLRSMNLPELQRAAALADLYQQLRDISKPNSPEYIKYNIEYKNQTERKRIAILEKDISTLKEQFRYGDSVGWYPELITRMLQLQSHYEPESDKYSDLAAAIAETDRTYQKAKLEDEIYTLQKENKPAHITQKAYQQLADLYTDDEPEKLMYQEKAADLESLVRDQQWCFHRHTLEESLFKAKAATALSEKEKAEISLLLYNELKSMYPAGSPFHEKYAIAMTKEEITLDREEKKAVIKTLREPEKILSNYKNLLMLYDAQDPERKFYEEKCTQAEITVLQGKIQAVSQDIQQAPISRACVLLTLFKDLRDLYPRDSVKRLIEAKNVRETRKEITRLRVDERKKALETQLQEVSKQPYVSKFYYYADLKNILQQQQTFYAQHPHEFAPERIENEDQLRRIHRLQIACTDDAELKQQLRLQLP